jgi:hypothetical protein
MSAKIMVNGKEYDSANLPPELSEKLKDLLIDKDGNGTPDIADNPFAMLGKLGQLSSIAKDAPVLLNRTVTQRKTGTTSAETPLMPVSTPRAPAKPASQSWMSASPPIKKDTGRAVLFWMAVLGLAGWGLWEYLLKSLL